MSKDDPEHSREALRRLAGGVAHDFNNLLAVIRTAGQTAALELPEGHPAHGGLADVALAAARAEALVRELVAIGRGLLLHLEVVDPSEVMRSFEPRLRVLAGDHIEFRAMYEDGLPPILIDKPKLAQVVEQLVVNARDAMPEGGTLAIDVRRARLNSEDVVGIVVRDSGCGMDDAVRARALDPFFTTKAGPSHVSVPGEIKHVGLGLAAAEGIVGQLGGRIEIESSPRKGATFTVLLPHHVAPSLHPGPVGVSIRPPPPPGAPTILLAEDERVLRRTVRRLLERQGYRVLEAVDGEDALRMCAEHDGSIDLVLTDVVMPRMGGRELVMRMNERYPNVRTLFMSGHAERGMANLGVPKSHMFLIEKPFNTDALVDRVRDLLREP